MLDTGGFNLSCRGNESLQWRSIGTVGVEQPGGALELTPSTATLNGDQTHTLTARLLDAVRLPLVKAAMESAVLTLLAKGLRVTTDPAATVVPVPGDPGTLTSKGHAYKTRGDYDDAVTAYRAAIASSPTHGEAYYSLANLKVYSFGADEITRMLESRHEAWTGTS